jgi:ribosome-binding protein aMBF1 (putative translation factor)
MRQTAKRDRHGEIVERRARKSATYRKTFARALQQIDLALLVREMREDAGLTQAELARKVGTTQSVIARLEDAQYAGHSLFEVLVPPPNSQNQTDIAQRENSYG